MFSDNEGDADNENLEGSDETDDSRKGAEIKADPK